MAPQTAVIVLHPRASAKPATGQPCNGCGWCCAFEPCPLGMLLSRRTRGACRALQWDDGAGRYGCGAVLAPRRHLRALRWLPRHWLRALALRWIGAGRGCDAALEGG